jgi:hypothetical protein
MSSRGKHEHAPTMALEDKLLSIACQRAPVHSMVCKILD